MLTFTDRAREMVQSFIDQSDGELSYLRIASHGSPMAPQFELTLVSESEREDEEAELDLNGFTVLIPETAVDSLRDATVDFVERVNESGFEVRPGAEPAAAARPEPPKGELADRVRDVLDSQVNPAIASHGGAISLVDVQDSEIFLEMSGGCQGCAMSRMTLRQGVERMLRQSIPELTAVHDITDHASGANPYFQA